ncbi:MAG: hypothetical protein PGN30_13075 [Mycolicibacterium neoaurum]|uniref:hypothetical protein n=1 Tax=Mycolicibacterium neoaurum TaxID=1795 RepID=UPI002FFD0491
MFAQQSFCLPNISGIVGRMEPQWERLGREVLNRRTSRGWSQSAVRERGGPSDTLQTKIESGNWRPSRGVDETLQKIDIGMEWLPGSASRVLAGGEPSYKVQPEDLRRPPGPLTAEEAESERTINEALEQVDRRRRSEPLPSTEQRGGLDGIRAAMRRNEIVAMPEAERTQDEVEWLAAYDAAHQRRLDPRIFPAGEKRPPEAIFDDWQAARNRMLNVVLEYAATRGIPFQEAEEELADVQQMASDVQLGTGRPWTPPWNPGAEFREGETPWKREWWAIIEQNIGGISTIGHSYDVEKVRRNRAGDEQRAEEWEAHRRSQLSKYDAEEASRIPGSRLVRATLDGLDTEMIIPPGTAPVDDTVLTQGLHRARVDAKAIETQHFALEDLLEKSRAFPTERVDDEVVDTAMAQFLLAVERYVIATDLLIRGFQNADLHASAEQIDVAINAFDFYAKVAASYVPFLESLAGNVQSEVQRLPVERTRRSLVTLIEWLDKTRDAWIDSGLSKTRSPSVLQHLTAARTAAPGYKPGRSEQGEADGEENQDPGGTE